VLFCSNLGFKPKPYNPKAVGAHGPLSGFMSLCCAHTLKSTHRHRIQCMHTLLDTNTHLHTHARTCTLTHSHNHKYTPTHTCTHAHAHTYVHTHTHTRTRTHTLTHSILQQVLRPVQALVKHRKGEGAPCVEEGKER